MEQVFSLTTESGSLSTLEDGQVAIGSKTAKKHGWKTGDTLPVTFDNDKKGELKVGATYRENEFLSPFVIPKEMADKYSASTPPRRSARSGSRRTAAPARPTNSPSATGAEHVVQIAVHIDLPGHPGTGQAQFAGLPGACAGRGGGGSRGPERRAVPTRCRPRPGSGPAGVREQLFGKSGQPRRRRLPWRTPPWCFPDKHSKHNGNNRQQTCS
ncbi:hypothetical protein SBADM41S_01023 [Streptomyces badius]